MPPAPLVYEFDVFLSRATADKEWAGRLADTLRERGLSAFLCDRCLKPGIEWAKALAEAAARSRYLVVVVTRSSITSSEVIDEWNNYRATHRTGGRIVPVRLEAGVDLPPWLTGRQCVEATGRDVAEVADELAAEFGPVVRRAGPGPARRSDRRAALLVTAAVSVLLVVMLVAATFNPAGRDGGLWGAVKPVVDEAVRPRGPEGPSVPPKRPDTPKEQPRGEVVPPKPPISSPPPAGQPGWPAVVRSKTIATPAARILIDAGPEEMDGWLKERRDANELVAWLDAYEVGDGEKSAYAAVARTGPARRKWVAGLRHPVARAPADLIDDAYALVSLCGQQRRGLAFLAQSGKRKGGFDWSVADGAANEIKALQQKDGVVLQVRPFTTPDSLVWVYHYEIRKDREESRFVLDADRHEVANFLGADRRPDTRPGSIAACGHKGRLAFGTTLSRDDGIADWDYTIGVTAAELDARAREFADKGYVPASVTGYAWDRETRFCAVWVKEKPAAGKP